MQQRVLEYNQYRYLKMSAAVLVVALCMYFFIPSSHGHRGSTFTGMSLGILSAAIILWLLWYGVVSRRVSTHFERRVPKTDHQPVPIERRKTSSQFKKRAEHTLQAWLSAHIYFGLLLIVLVALHAGFRFHFNVHTLAYFVLIFVEITGIYGIYTYTVYPARLTKNMGQHTFASLAENIFEIDHLCMRQALMLPVNLQKVVVDACKTTQLDGSLIERLRGKPMRNFTAIANRVLVKEVDGLDTETSMVVKEVARLMMRKAVLLQREWDDIKYKTRLKVWLIFHVPAAVALLAMLIVHVLAVSIFW